MSLTEAVKALKAERRELEGEIKKVDRAITLLEPPKPVAEPPKKKPKPRTPWSGPVEAVTCPTCGFVAKAAQGLTAHDRAAHPED